MARYGGDVIENIFFSILQGNDVMVMEVPLGVLISPKGYYNAGKNINYTEPAARAKPKGSRHPPSGC